MSEILLIFLRSRQILKALKSVCLENRKEKLYLANSKDLVALIVELGLTDYWPSLRFDKQVMGLLQQKNQHKSTTPKGSNNIWG